MKEKREMHLRRSRELERRACEIEQEIEAQRKKKNDDDNNAWVIALIVIGCLIYYFSTR